RDKWCDNVQIRQLVGNTQRSGRQSGPKSRAERSSIPGDPVKLTGDQSTFRMILQMRSKLLQKPGFEQVVSIEKCDGIGGPRIFHAIITAGRRSFIAFEQEPEATIIGNAVLSNPPGIVSAPV